MNRIKLWPWQVAWYDTIPMLVDDDGGVAWHTIKIIDIDFIIHPILSIGLFHMMQIRYTQRIIVVDNNVT